jgi:hypothetical protein
MSDSRDRWSQSSHAAISASVERCLIRDIAVAGLPVVAVSGIIVIHDQRLRLTGMPMMNSFLRNRVIEGNYRQNDSSNQRRLMHRPPSLHSLKLKTRALAFPPLSTFYIGILQHAVARHQMTQSVQDRSGRQATRNSCSIPSRSGSQRPATNWKPSGCWAVLGAISEVSKELAGACFVRERVAANVAPSWFVAVTKCSSAVTVELALLTRIDCCTLASIWSLNSTTRFRASVSFSFTSRSRSRSSLIRPLRDASWPE